jgi:colanic acid/amylovoran biosynthesis glycosyltransferase
MIRIAYLLSQYPAVNHIFMLREVRLLRKLGFEIHVASIRPPDRDAGALTSLEREETQSTAYIKSMRMGRLLAAHGYTLLTRPAAYLSGLGRGWRLAGINGLLYFAEAVAVGDWMRRNRLPHVHTHYVSTVGLLVSRIFPVTQSITFHGPAEFENPARSHLGEKVAASLFSCAISRYGLSKLMAATTYVDWHKLEVTPLGVNPREFPPRPFRRAPSPFQIVCVARLAPVKGQHVLIAAVQQLAKSGRRFRLRLAGDGPAGPELQQDVQNRGLSEYVAFEGNLNQDQLRELYRESDALVLPSFAEGLPVVLMEAMAMEIPCIASWVNGIPEIITHAVDGLLVPPADADALAGAMARLMDDADLRQSLGERGRVKVQEKYDLERNVSGLAAVFRKRLAGDNAEILR